MAGIIVIVGRPNVGKSALFNRIARRRIAIVHDQPGVTRDRVSAEIEWHGRPLTLVDTGGIGLLRGEKSKDLIVQAALDQVELAIEAADVILLVVNVLEGITALDREVADRLRRSAKQVILVVNKVDTYRVESKVDEFFELGFETIMPVTAIHGNGIEPLMDKAMTYLPKFEAPAASAAPAPLTDVGETEGEETDGKRVEASRRDSGPLKIAIVGRPNVGKSSLVNALTSSTRVIVTNIPGTTRDAVDVPFEVDTEGVKQSYILIDTAGMRKKRRVDDSIEFFSVKRTEESIQRADLVVFVLDAEAGILEQDKKVADQIVEHLKPCIIVVNKWDLVSANVAKARNEEIERIQKKTRSRDDRRKILTTLSEFGQWVQEYLFFLDYAPVIFTSAKDGFHLDRLLETIRYVAAQVRQTIPTGLLNRTLNHAIEQRQPVSVAGHRLKFFYATQTTRIPPTFLLFVNRNDLCTDGYKKYLRDSLRAAFGFEGCPLLIIPKDRPKTIEPKRKYSPKHVRPEPKSKKNPKRHARGSPR